MPAARFDIGRANNSIKLTRSSLSVMGSGSFSMLMAD
jgi:hypothetical protein